MDSTGTRKIYLIRHGELEFADGIRRCIGRTEIPLNESGRKQAERLYIYFQKHSVTKVFTSPLGRCQETAQILAKKQYPVQVETDLQELDMGEWENIPMQQLKNQYKKKLELEPDHGESREKGLKRFQEAMDKVLDHSKGDIICVAHAGINCCYLADLMGYPLKTSRALPQPYGGINMIEVDSTGRKIVKICGIMPEGAPDIRKCEQILDHYHTPETVREHCRAVCTKAVQIGRALNKAGCRLDLKLIQAASMLHDVARTETDHATEGAAILRREGYPKVAKIIEQHHDLEVHHEKENAVEMPTETEVVYLADKLIKGTKKVSFEERFAASRKRCEEQEDARSALAAHKRRYDEARKVKEKIESKIGSCNI